jgi:hypothetical protein
MVPMRVPDCGRFWRTWRRSRVGGADELGLYAADACLARGRSVRVMATRKFQIADVLPPQICRQRGRSGPLRRRRLSGTRTFCHRHSRVGPRGSTLDPPTRRW